jgi:hypothetical protein
VAIFQGIPLTILGFDLGSPEIVSGIDAEEVRALGRYPTFDQGIPAADRADALTIVEQIRRDIRAANRQEQKQKGSSP